MGRRLGQLTGVLALLLVIGRLGRLLQSGPDLVQWRLILVASVFLGGVIWWLLSQVSLSRPAKLGLFALGALILVLRISVPTTLIGGILPSAETFAALATEMDDAIRNIRFGIPPVLPGEGLTAILAVLMWVTGGLYAWGATGGPVAAMTLPSIVLYLQFAVFDRIEAGLGWMAGSTAILAMAIASVALDRSGESGRARDAEGRAIPRRSTATALVTAGLVGVVAIGATTSASGLVSEYGNMPWRSSGSGFGGEGGRVAFEPFVDLRQQLISRNNTLLFQATFGDNAPPPQTVYWRMFTLDVFDGTEWERSSGPILNYEEDQGVGGEYHRYQGSTYDFLAKVRIEQLGQDLAPTPGVATEVHDFSEEGAIDPLAFQVAQDSSLLYPPTFREGDLYQIRTVYADQQSDVDVLATDDDGDLSPLFASAVDAGELVLQADDSPTSIEEPPDLDFYTQLPDDIPSSIRGVAALRTRGAQTPYEQAWMLQYWFRDSGDFTYSTQVSTGHDALLLDEWLTEEDSTNYREGYCEQFAAAMAVLGRELGIPSRVVLGFTPGTALENGVIQVRDTNAHAWVEMWMPDVGWTAFDPTPRGDFQPASITAAFDPADYIPESGSNSPQEGLLDPTLQSDDAVGITDIPPADSLGTTSRWWLWIFPVLALAAIAPPLAKWVRRRRRLIRIRQGDITAIWDEIVDRLTDLGEPVPASLTPIEFARQTDDALLGLAVNYSASLYGNRPGGATETDLLQVEGWLERRYDTSRRVRAALSLRSFLEDD